MRRIFVYIGLLISLTAWPQSQASLQKQAYWEDFRNALPNPYQTIGFAAFDDHSQLYIISEPPKDITLDQIEEVFGFLLYDVETKKWEYGVDGWVKDVVVTVDHAPDSCQTEIIRQLNELLYGNAEQTIYQPLPFSRKRNLFLDETLDVRVNASSLYDWFVEDDMPVEDFMGNKTTFTDICSRSRNAVYRSSEPGFILWTLPKNGTIKVNDRNFRRFTINSDIILGAISSSNTVCIIGRERETDLLDVPPLRSEEAAMLAWAPNRLSQSLDVGGLVTGKMANNYDWCPAYLSDELVNTEVGHLMTLTDVFMKDWLQGATIVYDQYPYPKPLKKFEEGLPKLTSIRFNWNTDGLYSKTKFSPYQVCSVRNTGCLNCSLFDDSHVDETTMADKAANAYLASLNNVDLFRVAQYFMLYEIFKDNHITCPSYKPLPQRDRTRLLVSDARNTLNRIRSLREKEKDEIIRKVTEDYYDNLRRSAVDSAFTQVKEEERRAWEQKFEEEVKRKAKKACKSVEKYKKSAAYKKAKEKYDQAFEAYADRLYEESIKKDRDRKVSRICESINRLWDVVRSIPEKDIEGFCGFSSCPHVSILPAARARYRQYQFDIVDSWGLLSFGPAF